MAKYGLKDWREARRKIRDLKNEVSEDEGLMSLSMGGLRRRKEQLEAAYRFFRKCSEQLMTRLTVAPRAKVQKDGDQVHDWYVWTGDALNAAMNEAEMTRPTANSTLLSATDRMNRTEVIRVEAPRPPELLEFNGDPLGWPAFRDRFTAEVHVRDHIDPVMKLIYLQKMCVGEARAILGDWQPITVNYARAWATLQEKFEDTYQIQQALVAQMINMPTARDDTRPALRGLIDTVTNVTRQLQALGVDITSWDPMIIGMMMKLLPARVKEAWEQRRDVERPPALKELLTFLEARARGKLYTDNQVSIPGTSGGNYQFQGRMNVDKPRNQ